MWMSGYYAVLVLGSGNKTKHNITKGVLLLLAEVESEQPASDQKGWSIYPPTASGAGAPNLAFGR